MAKEYAATISIRVTFEERAQIEAQAGKLPVSTFLKSLALTPDLPPPPQKRSNAPIQDYVALAKIFALLGQIRQAQRDAALGDTSEQVSPAYDALLNILTDVLNKAPKP